MAGKVVNRDMTNWSGVILLLVCTPTTQLLQSIVFAYGQDVNSMPKFLDESPVNHFNSFNITHNTDIGSLLLTNSSNIIDAHQTIIRENITVQTMDIAPNDTLERLNISTKLENAVKRLGVSELAPISSSRPEMVILYNDTKLFRHRNFTATNGPITDIMYDEFPVTIFNLQNDSSPMGKIGIINNDNRLFLKNSVIPLRKMSDSSPENGRKNVENNKMQTNNSDVNNHYSVNNNLVRSKLNGIYLQQNSIGRSNVEKQFIITRPPAAVDDKNMQQMKQLMCNKKLIDSPVENVNDSFETFVNRTDLQLQNITLSFLTKQWNCQSNADNIPHNVSDDDVSVKTYSHLSDKRLRKVIENSVTHPKIIPLKNITPVQTSIHTRSKESDSNETLTMPHPSAESYTSETKLLSLPFDMTENSTETPQVDEMYSSSISSSTIQPYYMSNDSDSTLLDLISPTSIIHAVTSDTASVENAEKTGGNVITSPTFAVNSLPSTNNAQANDTRSRQVAVDRTTMSIIEYEFIALNATTIDAVVDMHNFNADTMENWNQHDSDSYISTMTIINSSDIPEVSSNSNKSLSITTDTPRDTTVHTPSTNNNFYDTTSVITDEITTSISYTATFTFHTSTVPSMTTVVNRDSIVIDASEESMILDVTDTTAITTTITSATSVFEYNIEAKTYATRIDSATVIDLENGTTVSTLHTTSDTKHLVTENDTVIVKMNFETGWSNVCQQLSTLKQVFADVLSAGIDKIFLASQIIFRENLCTSYIQMDTGIASTNTAVPLTFLLYVVDRDGAFDAVSTKLLPSLYRDSSLKLQNISIHSFQLIEASDTSNSIAVIIVSCVAFTCLVLLASLLFVMRKRQTRFNYGERCRPVSLDAYSLDNISAFNSVRRKGAMRMSKRSYGNPAFEDSNAIPSHPLNYAGISAFHIQQNAINEEFISIPQLSMHIAELPIGAEIKNRYANIIPLPETRVPLMKIDNDPVTEYINASYIRGPNNVSKYYIGCQAPIDTTVIDFWRMIWEQQSKLIIMLTDLIENGIEKCAEYIPPSEVTDCHRLYGCFDVTLKKREIKEKYAISTIHLKNLEANSCREVAHIWYLWPMNGIQMDAAGLIAVLLEARAIQRDDSGPIVVHCSPGTGRTGTLIALDLGIRQYEMSGTVDVPKIVYTIRKDRAGAVQTKEQYCFIYKALNFYATKLVSGKLEST